MIFGHIGPLTLSKDDYPAANAAVSFP